jgi:DNA-binding response OmpR family regulator
LHTALPIVAIAKDPALLQSLAFALRAHGYDVLSFMSWQAGQESAVGAGCVILDGCLPRDDQEACLKALGDKVGVVVLSEDDLHVFDRRGLRILQKPLSGVDVVAAVSAIRDEARR